MFSHTHEGSNYILMMTKDISDHFILKRHVTKQTFYPALFLSSQLSISSLKLKNDIKLINENHYRKEK